MEEDTHHQDEQHAPAGDHHEDHPEEETREEEDPAGVAPPAAAAAPAHDHDHDDGKLQAGGEEEEDDKATEKGEEEDGVKAAVEEKEEEEEEEAPEAEQQPQQPAAQQEEEQQKMSSTSTSSTDDQPAVEQQQQPEPPTSSASTAAANAQPGGSRSPQVAARLKKSTEAQQATAAAAAAQPAPAHQQKKEKEEEKEEARGGSEGEGSGGGGWGGWGGWWTATSTLVSSVTESATKAATQIADQLNTALLEDEGDNAEESKDKGKEKVKDDENEGLLDYLSTVLQQQVQGAEKSAASMLESTLASINQFSLEQSVELGQKLTMQSLDMLEAVGKKTIETLELDEQLQQTLSQHLEQQGAEQTEQTNSAIKIGPVPVVASPKPVRQKAVTFESNFEDSYGKAHLEALEHLSASCLMIFYKANPQTLKKLAGSLKRIEKLFNEDDDEDDEEQELDSKLLRRLNRKARMKRKVIEKFVAASKDGARQLVEEFMKEFNKPAEGEQPKTPEQLNEETLAQLTQTSKNAMLRLSELSAAAVELLLRVAESYLVGVTAPVVVPEAIEDSQAETADMDSHEETEESSTDEDVETPALVVNLLAKSLARLIEEVIQAFADSATSITKTGKAALQGSGDSAKLIAELDKKMKATKKEVESKYGSSALDTLQEAKKMFLNISKAVLVNPSVTSASPSPASPSVFGSLKGATTPTEKTEPAAETSQAQTEN